RCSWMTCRVTVGSERCKIACNSSAACALDRCPSSPSTRSTSSAGRRLRRSISSSWLNSSASTSTLARLVANVDVLALEFNHDEEMERRSRRPAELVERVLGDEGHLSNAQAAELLQAILQRSEPTVTRHVIQLHL